MKVEPLEGKSDERGVLVEAFDLPTDGQIFYLKIAPNAVRGNHYHKRKTEVFLVVEGTAVLRARERKTGIIGEVTLRSDEPTAVSVHPGYTHSIAALSEGAIVVVWSNTRYNPNSRDTYAEEV